MPELQIQFPPAYIRKENIKAKDLQQLLNAKLLNVIESPMIANNMTLTDGGLLKVQDITISKGMVSIRGKVICAISAMHRVAQSLGGHVVQ